jgi:threonine dehydratase
MMQQLEYVKRILNAQVYDAAVETPISRMHFISKSLLNEVYIKREDLQPVFSFKIRGAMNKLRSLTPAQQAAGVIAASAGNHAQGVALGAKIIGIKAVIVMPVTTPEIKVISVKENGAQVILHGDSFDEACQQAHKIAKKRKLFFIHPYDDIDVIAGQGTIAMEILRQHNHPLDAIFIPVGGGGLIAGMAAYIKCLRPEIRIIGVEPENAASLKAALDAGRRVTLKQTDIFADGVAVATIGKEPLRIARKYVDDVVTVSTDEICTAIRDIFNDTRSIAEPAGAVALAGLKNYVRHNSLTGRHLMAIESGANLNFKQLRYVSQRTDIGEHEEVLLAVTIPEVKGSMKEFYKSLRGYDLTEFNYRYNDPAKAHFLVGINVSGDSTQFKASVKEMNRKGYLTLNLNDNEFAKAHLRNMAGGAAPHLENERIFRFQFPERPGALLQFLRTVPRTWNISLFNYRKQGGSYAQVCIGLQIPADSKESFKCFAKKLNYQYIEETDNPACKLFL